MQVVFLKKKYKQYSISRRDNGIPADQTAFFK